MFLFQVSLSTWEEGSLHPSLDYSVSIDPSASVQRNPFSEKRWKKFHLSRIFSTSPDAIKMHVLDVHITQGDRSFVDKWFVVLCLGSGKTRNMALDRYAPNKWCKFFCYNIACLVYSWMIQRWGWISKFMIDALD